MITGRLIKAARILAGLDVDALAAKAGVEPAALAGLEAAGEGPGIPGEAVFERTRRALEGAGIAFLDDGGVGVMLRSALFDEGLRPEELTAENDD
ncbi:DNA-binding protein [Alsobacter sp. SYSU M60028]|uniref:DNA-binding protein n=1 Tax=Alsobacter ponti TaxID=2962936 RepID=A0ABT1L8P6_9HYPH|nr:DNA-binding protein [Alsobacter ponti]MCP8937870.1 DNA-binding protein [Alsobacter ponti]